MSLNPSCPSDGNWYACLSGSHFVGCCTSDPCTKGCPSSDIRPASFDSTSHGQFQGQSCSSGALWYTCADSKPPFMGCCKSNPCNDGCPEQDLVGAILNSGSSNGYVLSSMSSSSQSSTSTSTSPTTSSSSTSSQGSTSIVVQTVTTVTGESTAAATAAQSSTTQAPTATKPTALQPGAIAGIAVGGFAAAVLVMAACMWWCRRHSRQSRDGHPLMAPKSKHPSLTEPLEFMYRKFPLSPSLSRPPAPPSKAQSFEHFRGVSTYMPQADNGPDGDRRFAELPSPPAPMLSLEKSIPPPAYRGVDQSRQYIGRGNPNYGPPGMNHSRMASVELPA